MSTFTVETKSTSPETDFSASISVPEVAGREYATVVNAGIAKVLAAAGAILIGAEYDGDIRKALDDGMAMVAKIGS